MAASIPELDVSYDNETCRLVKSSGLRYAHSVDEEKRTRVGRKRSEASRRAILDAALELLRDGSYGVLTSDAIAAKAGVGKQTIYRWWESKAEVVLEALTEHARAVAAPDTGGLEGDVRAFFEATFRLLRGPRGTGHVLRVLMAEAQLDPAFAPRFAAFIETRRTALRAVLLRRARADSAAVDAMVDMLFGALWYRLLLGHAPLDKALAGRLGSLAAHGLGRPRRRALTE
jgi:AcrR family transcriptional regulator